MLNNMKKIQHNLHMDINIKCISQFSFLTIHNCIPVSRILRIDTIQFGKKCKLCYYLCNLDNFNRILSISMIKNYMFLKGTILNNNGGIYRNKKNLDYRINKMLLINMFHKDLSTVHSFYL